MPLAQTLLVRAEDERHVGKHRHRSAERVKQQHVLGRVRNVIVTADDVRDPHVDVIDHDRQVIERMAIGSDDDEVFKVGAVELDPPMHDVVESDDAVGHLEADRALIVIRAARIDQSLRGGPMPVVAGGLKVWRVGSARVGTFVPRQPEPPEALKDPRHHVGGRALDIGVFDAQHERPAVAPGVQPVEERRPGAADVQKTCGGWSKANARDHTAIMGWYRQFGRVVAYYSYSVMVGSYDARLLALLLLALILVTAFAVRRFSRHFTLRQRAEDALRETEDRMRFALEAAGVGTWETDLTIGTGRWSTQLKALHGVDTDTFPGTVEAFLAHVHPDERVVVRDAIDRERRDWNVVYQTIWPDGSEHAVNEIGRAIYNERGVPVRTAGVGIDVTERHQLEMQFRQAQKMDGIGQLAGGVAHDFNNLLTAIIGFTELTLARLEPDHRVRQDVEQVLYAALSASALTRQLLAFGRKQILQPQSLNLNVLIGRMETLLRRTLGAQVQLVTRCDLTLKRVNADPGQIEQVLMNLAINARDAMPGGGTLTIETATVIIDTAYAEHHPGSSRGAHAMIGVSDTGIGMDEATRGRLFEPFFTTKEPGQGTGLGLATVYGIVQQSGGSIWVHSEVGRGTTFKVYLPQAARGAEEAPPAVLPKRLEGTETILVVEDQDAVRDVARATLERQGLRCSPPIAVPPRWSWPGATARRFICSSPTS